MKRPRQQIPPSDLTTRFTMGVVLIAVACFAIWAGGWPFRVLVTAAAAIMLVEWADMHKVGRQWSYVGIGMLALLLLVAMQFLYPVDEMEPAITADSFQPAQHAMAIALGAAALIGLASRRLTMFGGFLYVAVPAVALLVIEWFWFQLVFWAMVVTWTTDIFAYFAGRTIGGAKLAPRISPNKTWAGLIGGVLGAAIIGGVTAWWLDLGAPFVYLGALMAVVAQAGDLYESWLKRRANVKDSSSLLPGHGGALDRLDGVLPVAVVTFGILLWGL